MSVGENGGIVAFKRGANRQPGSIFIDFLLGCLVVIDMVEGVLVSGEIVAVIDVHFKIILVQSLQIVVLEQLDCFFVLEHLDCRDEDLAVELAGEGRSDSDDHFDVVPFVVVFLAFLHHLNFNY